MDHTIDVDDDVMGCLKAEAEPFVDTPNSVLRRLLQLDGPLSSANGARAASSGVPLPSADVATAASPERAPWKRTAAKTKRKKSSPTTRVAAGSILPEEEYSLPLLQALMDAGGSAPSRVIVEAVGNLLDGRLTDIDRQPLNSGAIRWENRIQFVRLKMIERGWMDKNAPRGTWAISDEGRKQLEGRNK